MLLVAKSYEELGQADKALEAIDKGVKHAKEIVHRGESFGRLMIVAEFENLRSTIFEKSGMCLASHPSHGEF